MSQKVCETPRIRAATVRERMALGRDGPPRSEGTAS